MSARKPRKLQRQQKVGFRGISQSEKTKLFAEIAVATLLIGIFLSPATNASTTASVTLTCSGTISSASGLHVVGNKIYTASGTQLIIKGMDYTYFMDTEGGSWMMPDGSIQWSTNPSSTTGVADFLNFMQASGCNVVRVILTVQYWIANSNSYESNLEYFITQAASRGIYVDLCPWRMNSTGTGPSVLPWTDGNNIINSSAEFVNFWGNLTTTLKSYPTVLFELWNEPQGNEAIWFSTTQSCVTDIRSIGATQPIVVQYGYQLDYDFYAGYSGSSGVVGGMPWACGMSDAYGNNIEYPLNDPSGNLVYSIHLYSYLGGGGFYNSSNGHLPVDDYNDLLYAVTQCGLLATAASHPVFCGEVGDNLATGNQTEQDVWFNNILTILDQNGIGYAGWAAPPWRSGATDFGYVIGGDANYTLDSSGVILVSHLGGMNYKTWLNLQS